MWAHRQGIELWLIEPGKPDQNACVDSFTGMLLHGRLNEHQLTSLDHAKRVLKLGDVHTTEKPSTDWRPTVA
jgi:putative transposase